MEKLEMSWLDAIVKLYEKRLKLNTDMMKGTKREKAKGYIEVLEEARQEVMRSNNKELEQLFKNFYHDMYVIKEEDIPYSVYEKEQEIARERGYGNIPITEGYKKEKNEEIIKDQETSLDKWLEYFLYDEEAKNYEGWEVFWVLEGLQTLGKYDKEKKVFSKRDNKTIYAYPPVEREVIFTTLNLMEEYLKTKKGEEEIKAALGQANFKQLYEYSIKALSSGKSETYGVEGQWIKYEQGSDYHVLRNSLQGYNTGWCTAAGESFAKSQLEGGDFYVYYSKDENGENKIPRIAIRMNGHDEIGEVRGIADKQNMEGEMLPILDEKLKEFPDREKYYKKERDMALLTKIDKKVKRKEELTKEELRFLYELDDKVEGFGYEKDPRIEEIILKRDWKEDIASVLGCSKEEISDNKQDILDGKDIKYFRGSLYLRHLTDVKGLKLPEIISGDLYLSHLRSAAGLKLPKTINGGLYLNNLRSAEGLVFPEAINGDLDLSGLETAEGLTLPETINGCLFLESLESAKGLTLPETINGSLDLSGLESAEGLVLPETINGSLFLESLRSAEGLKLPETLNGGCLVLGNLESTKGLTLPEIINGYLDLASLKSVKGLTLPETINGFLNLRSLESAKGLTLPEKLNGTLDLRSLQSVEGIVISPEFSCEYIRASDEVRQEIRKKIEEAKELPFRKETGMRALAESTNDVVLDTNNVETKK